MATFAPRAKWHEEKSDGTPAAGYKVFFYEPGTTTKKTTYTTTNQTVANTNPVILDSDGNANVCLDGRYKVVFAPDTDSDPPTSPIYTVDNWPEVTTTSDVDNNLITDGSFETDSDGDGVADGWLSSAWTGGTVSLDTSDSDHGGKSVKMVSTGSGGGTYTQSVYVPVSASRTYTLSWLMKSSVADVKNIVEIMEYDSDLASVATVTAYSDATTNPTSWTEKTYTYTPTATTVYAKIKLTGCDSTDATSGTTRYDDVHMGVTTSTGTYVGLTDTPSSFTGQGAKLSRVDPAASATITFAEPRIAAGYSLFGYKNPCKFAYSSTTAITIGAGSYHLAGTEQKIVSVESSLTYTFGSGGSNATSDDLTATAYHYLFIDDSAVSSGTITLSASSFRNDTTAPTKNEAKGGWYTGNDRCIAAFRTNSSSQIEDFIDLGTGWIQPHGWQASSGFDKFLSGGTSTSYAALSPDVPAGTSAIQVNWQRGLAIALYISTDGTTDDYFIQSDASEAGIFITALNSSLQIYYKKSAPSNSINLYTTAYKVGY